VTKWIWKSLRVTSWFLFGVFIVLLLLPTLICFYNSSSFWLSIGLKVFHIINIAFLWPTIVFPNYRVKPFWLDLICLRFSRLQMLDPKVVDSLIKPTSRCVLYTMAKLAFALYEWGALTRAPIKLAKMSKLIKSLLTLCVAKLCSCYDDFRTPLYAWLPLKFHSIMRRNFLALKEQ